MAEKNPAARPVRSEKLAFMATPNEKEELNKAATSRGVNLGKFMRDAALFQARSTLGSVFHQALPRKRNDKS